MTTKQTLMYLTLGLLITLIVIFFALSQNLNHFCETSEIVTKKKSLTECKRIGGIVEKNSVIFLDNGDLKFNVTDSITSINVKYNGILPDLFREGQGIIAIGKLTSNKSFLATQILAKHDENYTPMKPKAQQQKEEEPRG